jgi:ATP-dependent DNA ligase
MRFRYPDKPAAQIARELLPELPGYFATLKMDGWRAQITVTDSGPFVYLSRENKPLAVSRPVAEPFEAAVRARGIPVGSLFDGEWLCRRPAAREEALWVFDLLEHGTSDLRQTPALERFRAVRGLLEQYTTPMATSDFGRFYDEAMQRPDAEGIVLKRCTSPFIGSYSKCALNPAWMKCKWRGGEDGRTQLGRTP